MFVVVVSINTLAGFIIGWFFYATARWAYAVVSLHATVLPSGHPKKGCERDKATLSSGLFFEHAEVYSTCIRDL